MGLISKIKKSFEIVEELRENRMRLSFAIKRLKCEFPNHCGAGDICDNCYLKFFFRKLEEKLNGVKRRGGGGR